MARNPNYTLSWSILDRSNEIGRTSINTADFIAVSTPLPAAVTNFQDDFLAFLSEGESVALNSQASRKLGNEAFGVGNREDKWLVRYQDNVTLVVYTFQVPCRKSTLVTIAGTNVLNPDNTANPGYSDAVTAFNAIVRSPDGNAVSLLDIQVI